MQKINWKKVLAISGWCLVIGILLYTRFINLGWGLPYPLHPDEYNMALAVMQMNIRHLYNPNFWSYGGFQINIAHMIIVLWNFIFHHSVPIRLSEAIMGLRLVSAVVSMLMVYLMLKIITFSSKEKQIGLWIVFGLAIFSPALIQFAHFGTTESMLMFLYVAILYGSLHLYGVRSKKKYVLLTGLLAFLFGVAIATKISSLFFFVVILAAILLRFKKEKKPFGDMKAIFLLVLYMIFIMTVSTLFLSPHYFLYTNNFLSSLFYEQSLVTGKTLVFYTKQFLGSLPFIFQASSIFPFALGMPVFLLAVTGFILLPWRSYKINFIRLALFTYIIPNSLLFAKWTRYMAPIFPMMLLLAMLFCWQLHHWLKQYWLIVVILVFLALVPGIAYLSIYQEVDVRYQASHWMIKNIPANSQIFTESANLYNLPITSSPAMIPPLQVASFFFYDLDINPVLQQEFQTALQRADYIIVPSRRVFMNYTCEREGQKLIIKSQKCDVLRQEYPLLNEYYHRLFSGKLGFKKIAEFTSYPKISLFGKTLLEFPDEQAEETWSVFDHPVIRIYKKI